MGHKINQLLIYRHFTQNPPGKGSERHGLSFVIYVSANRTKGFRRGRGPGVENGDAREVNSIGGC
jgi:hypothetical protein